MDKVEGANAPALTNMVKKYSDVASAMANTTPVPQAEPVDLNQKLKTLINSYPVMLFMKGTPASPKCGFSRQTVELLAEVNCAYGSFDILSDEQVRQGI